MESLNAPATDQGNESAKEITQGEYSIVDQKLTIDLPEAERFLTLLDEEAEAFTFQTFADSAQAKAEDAERERNKQPKKYAHVFNGPLSRHADALERLNQKGAGVFVTANKTDLEGRKYENITGVRAVFSDTDGAPLDPIMRGKPEPHFIVESSPRNWHTYWMVDALPLAQFEGVQRRISDTYATDASVTDLPRVLRLPGFYHRKGEPFMVRVMHDNGGLPYTADKILAAFPPLEKEGTSRQARKIEISEDDEILRALNDAGMVRSIRLDAGYNVACPFEDEHTIASGETETVYYPANTGGFKTPAFKCMHAHCADRRLNDYREKLNLNQVTEPREYAELLADAKKLTKESDPDAVDTLLKETIPLSPTKKRQVWQAIKKATGIPFSVMEQTESACSEDDGGGGNDDLQLARALVEEIDQNNVMAADTFVWQWRDTGVWQKQEDRSVKQWVQHHLADNVEGVKKSLVDSVSDLFRTEVFKPHHLFNIGPSECVNTLNGELVLIDGHWQLTPHNRNHYRTTQVPVEYDTKAEAPRFIKFMTEVFKGDDDAGDKAQALLEMIGYSLMAHCRHEKFIIMVGSGANGKSVLLSVLEALAGPENVAGVQPSQFDRSFQRAHLHGKLTNIVTEIKQGEMIDDASLKGIVSGEPTTVEHKFKDPFVMRPFSTCWFGTNHMPHTRDFSDALFRRALVVEFNNKFKPEMGNCDPQLKDKLMGELPGILSLALDAYADALSFGFTMPESCQQARERWRLEADQVAQFVEDECEHEPVSKVRPQALYDAYKEWAEENGIHKRLAQKSFGDRLLMLGFERKKSDGVRYITGVRCKRAVDFRSYP